MRVGEVADGGRDEVTGVRVEVVVHARVESARGDGHGARGARSLGRGVTVQSEGRCTCTVHVHVHVYSINPFTSAPTYHIAYDYIQCTYRFLYYNLSKHYPWENLLR